MSPAKIIRELSDLAVSMGETVTEHGRTLLGREDLAARSPEAWEVVDRLVMKAAALVVEADEALEMAEHIEAAACGGASCACGQRCGS